MFMKPFYLLWLGRCLYQNLSLHIPVPSSSVFVSSRLFPVWQVSSTCNGRHQERMNRGQALLLDRGCDAPGSSPCVQEDYAFPSLDIWALGSGTPPHSSCVQPRGQQLPVGTPQPLFSGVVHYLYWVPYVLHIHFISVPLFEAEEVLFFSICVCSLSGIQFNDCDIYTEF